MLIWLPPKRRFDPTALAWMLAPEASLRLILCAPSIGKMNASFPPAVVGGAHEIAIASLRERTEEIPQHRRSQQVRQCASGSEKAQHVMRRPRRNRRDKRVTREVSMPFYRELRALQAQYDQMASALDGKDPARVRGTACGAALAWLRMEAAFIQFIDCTPVERGLGHNARPQRLVLTSSNYLLRRLFRRALEEMSKWAMSKDDQHVLRMILRWLHERLQLWTAVELPVLRSQRAQRIRRSKRRATRI